MDVSVADQSAILHLETTTDIACIRSYAQARQQIFSVLQDDMLVNKQMKVRDYVVPGNFEDAMGRGIPGFNNLEKAQRTKVAFYIWMAGTNRRQHRTEDGMCISCEELRQAFGKGGFKAINDTLQIFDIGRNWSKKEKLTRSYKLTEHAQKVMEDFLDKVEDKITPLLTLDGNKMRTVPNAIASKDKNGVTAIAWKDAKAPDMIRVDVDKMREVLGHMENMLIRKRSTLSANAQVDNITYQIGILKRLIILSNNDVTGRGDLIHRYEEAGSGRLYAQGISLQNTPKLLRKVALHGLYDYDVENCHYSIFYQLTDQYNFVCEAIKYYLTHKKETREAIAKEIGITIEEAKTCLLAPMFGAKRNTWKDNSIPKVIGKIKSSALFKHPTFKAITDELSHGRKLILKGSTKRKTTLINVMGKPISLKETSNQKLAHIIQGIDAQALKACLTLYPDDIVLLMHDGFVSKKALDVPLIERTIYKATGMQLQLSEDVITLPSELDFSNL